MTLSCNGNGNARKGVFVSEVKIISAEDVSGQTPLPFKRPLDIGIRLTLDIGRSFTPQLVIGGNFARDERSTEVVGWSSGWVVSDFLSKMGYGGVLAEGNKIPPDVLEGLAGKSFLRLSYVTNLREDGRPRYNDWNLVATVAEGAESLIHRFERSVAKGYPKGFHPELLVNPNTTQRSDTTAAEVDESPF